MKKSEFSLLVALALFTLLTAAPFEVFAGQHDPIKENTTSKASREQFIERISAEPDANQQIETLRWSPNGTQVAWLNLVIPPAKAAIKTPQREIWTLAPVSSASDDKSAESMPAGPMHPVLLLSTTKVTNALRGTDAPLQPKLGDDDAESNSFLLQDFAWSTNNDSLLLIGTQSIAWLELSSGKSHIVLTGDESVSDVSLAPDTRTISFIRNHSLWLVSADGGQPRLLAKTPHEGVIVGEPDWPYRNDLHLSRAYEWSPDSSRIAFLETDDRAVDKYTLRKSSGEARQIVCPKPGGELPLIRVLVQRIAGGEPVEMNLGPTKNYYLPRIAWLPDGRRLAIERLDRRQQALDLFLADTVTGKTRLLFTEKDKYWINVSDDLYFLKDGKTFLWSSERNGGFRHLYLYDLQGKELVQLTRGDWEVTSLNAVDETRQQVYFTATEKTPLERHLYAIKLDGTGMKRITQMPGTHEIRFAAGAARFSDSYSSRMTPPQLSILDVEHGDAQLAGISGTQHQSQPSTDKTGTPGSANLQPVEFMTLSLHMGATVHAFVIKPSAFDPTRKYPVIVYLAGGPGEQLVRDNWAGSAGLWMQLMAQQGYIIFALDNQGTTGRGHYFEEPIHLRLGAQELGDQRDGVLYLKTLPYVDQGRIGVCGWGYGGFLVLHAMLDRPVPFAAGFAGAPIVDWHYYDAVFAERYLDDPVVHADGWATSVALANDSPRFFKGSLMVAQGTQDEVVHMENVLTLQDHLLDEGKSADILLLSDRGHRIDDPPTRRLLFTRMTEFFLKNL